MVGVGTAAAHHADGCVHLQAVLGGEKADEFRNHHGGVGVVDLDHGVIWQIEEVGTLRRSLVQDEASRAAHHKILLVDPEHPAGVIAVVGVEEEGEVFLDIRLVKGDSLPDDTLIHCLQVEEVQGVGAVLVADDGDIVHPGGEGEIAVGNLVDHIGFDQPGGSLDPGVGLLPLQIVPEGLPEQAHVVV